MNTHPTRKRCARFFPARFFPMLLPAFLAAGIPPAWAQVPACGAADRHFDPSEVPVAPVGAGTVYYVDSASGSDSSDGLTEQTAFKTISRAVAGDSAPVGPGATVRIKAGRYRERPNIVKSGTASSRITIGAFGNGEVVLDASDAVNGWTLVSGQTYKASPGFSPSAVVVDDQPLFPEFSQSALSEGRWFYDSSSGSLYLWAPGGGNPAGRDVGVVRDDLTQYGAYLNHASYVTLYGLTVRFSGGHGISIAADHVRVEKCRARFNGKAGINLFTWGSVPTTGAEIIKNEVYHNVLSNWPRGRWKWGGWSGATANQGVPNALFQGNVVHRNGGEGLLTYLGAGGTVFRDNVVYDNWSVNVYIDNVPNVVAENNFVYSHQPDSQDLYNNGDTTPSDGVNFKRLRPVGIMTADEDYGSGSHLNNVTIANNIILNCRRGVHHYAVASGSGLKNVRIRHNTIVAPAVLLGGEPTTAGLMVPYNGGNNTATDIRNNIVYASDPSTWLLYAEDTTATGDSFKGLTFSNNLWLHTTKAKPFHWGPSWDATFDYTQAGWLALAGSAHGAGDIYADPELVDVETIDVVEAKLPLSSSPALNTAVDAGVSLDYDFCPRPAGDSFDLGAYETTGGAPLPSLSIGDATLTEGNSGTTNAVFTVTLSAAKAQSVTVSWATANGTASAPSDYAAASGVLSFAAGATSATLSVAVSGDNVVEGDETFRVNLSNPAGASIADGQGTGTISNDDVATGGSLEFGAASYSVSEAAGVATLSVKRTGSSSGACSVHYATSNGTATAGADYTAKAGTLSFAPGASTATFKVPILNDSLDEADETVKLTLSAPTGGAGLGSNSSALLTIVDDDIGGTLKFSAAGYSVSESARTATINVTRSGGAAGGVRVSYATSPGSASPTLDYTNKSGTLSFAAGASSASFRIPIVADTLDEADETLNLTLSNPSGGATLGTPTAAVLTISDDDSGGTLAFSSATYATPETGQATITVTRSGGSASGVKVNYAMSNGTATAGSDYTAKSGTLSFAAGVTARSFTVPITSDTRHEADETINLALSSPTGGASLGTPKTALLTISDDDP